MGGWAGGREGGRVGGWEAQREGGRAGGREGIALDWRWSESGREGIG